MQTARSLALLGVAGIVHVATPARAFTEAEVRAIVGNQDVADSVAARGGAWMARQRRIEFDGVGNVTTREHHLARVVDPAWGESLFSAYSIPYWRELQSVRVEKARIWRPGEAAPIDLGREKGEDRPLPAALGAKPYAPFREVLLHFSGLRSGDTIELRWVRRDDVAPTEQNIRYGEHLFGSEEATIESQLILVAPTALALRTAERHPQRLLVEATPRGEIHVSGWLSGHLEPLGVRLVESIYSKLPVERTAPTVRTALAETPAVAFTTAADWPWVSDYYGKRWDHKASEGVAGTGIALSEILQRHISPPDRARAIERYVQEEVRTLELPVEWTGLLPLPAGEIQGARAGAPRDKAALLVGLLRAAGIRSHAVFVRTRPEPWNESIACPAQLDRFLVRVLLASGETLWLDPLESTTPLPASLGLILAPHAEGVEQGLVDFPGREGTAIRASDRPDSGR